MWHKQSFTQFWSQSDAYSRRSSLKLTYIHHPLVVCTHQICCAVAVPIALSQDRLLHGHNRLVNWTPCSRMRESKLKSCLQNGIHFFLGNMFKPCYTRIILGMVSTNERQCYIVMLSLIGWAHTQSDPCCILSGWVASPVLYIIWNMSL